MKTDKNIEQLFLSGKKISLDTDEKASIKTSLLTHARETLTHETRSIPSLWSSWVLRGSLSFASLLIVFIGTTYASHDSLPSEPLYAVKVHVLEEMVAFTKITPEEQVEYSMQLMENRLGEIREIVSQDTTLSPEDLETLTDQIDEHSTDITTTLEETTSDHIPYGEKMEVLSRLSGVTEAQSKIAKKASKLSGMAHSIDETQESTVDAMIITIDDFVDDESAWVVNEYLSNQITDVGAYVIASTTEASARNTAERHLHDVDEALIDGDTTEALVSILEAQQTITADAYLQKVLRRENLDSPEVLTE